MSHEPMLSKRERTIMDIVYARGQATAGEIRAALVDPPSYNAVRGLLRVLVEKGHLRVRRDGVRNVYRPTRSRRRAGRSAMKRALEIFFGHDVKEAMAALLDVSGTDLTPAEREQLVSLIRRARKEGR